MDENKIESFSLNFTFDGIPKEIDLQDGLKSRIVNIFTQYRQDAGRIMAKTSSTWLLAFHPENKNRITDYGKKTYQGQEEKEDEAQFIVINPLYSFEQLILQNETKNNGTSEKPIVLQ